MAIITRYYSLPDGKIHAVVSNLEFEQCGDVINDIRVKLYEVSSCRIDRLKQVWREMTGP